MGCCASSNSQKPNKPPKPVTSSGADGRILVTDVNKPVEPNGSLGSIARSAVEGISRDDVILSDPTSPTNVNRGNPSRSASSSEDMPMLSPSSIDRELSLPHARSQGILPEIDENSPSAIDDSIDASDSNFVHNSYSPQESPTHVDYKVADAQREAQFNKRILTKPSTWIKKTTSQDTPTMPSGALREEASVPESSPISPVSDKNKADIIRKMDTLAELADSLLFDKQSSSSIDKASLFKSTVSALSSQNKFSAADTIIIFDWDDTLCPSFWFRADPRVLWDKRAAEKNAEVQKLVMKYQRSAVRLLRAAKLLGHVEILTCSRRPWVYTTSHNFLPKIEDEVGDMTVIYAMENKRTTGIDEDSEDFIPKITENSITDTLTQFYSKRPRQAWKNIISIGDGHSEHDAMIRATMKQSHCRVKCVKLITSPSIQILTSELTVLRSWLLGIIEYNKSININLESSQEDIEHYTTMFFNAPCDV